MSVFTTVEQTELEHFLSHYTVGKLLDFKGISAGIENTNYFVNCESGQYVLTLFETLNEVELPYFLELMAFLAEHNFPSAHPLADTQSHYLRQLNNKPAALIHRLPGAHIKIANLRQCAEVARALGHMHAVSSQFSGSRDNQRGLDWMISSSKALLTKLEPAQQDQLQQEIDYQCSLDLSALPRGVIHADLFRDNALFEGDKLTGIIDFYYACNDVLLYDLAITVNDWCVYDNGELDPQRTDAFIAAYQSEHSLSANERELWPAMLRAAALRFWISRLLDWHFPRDGELTHSHDPDVFKNILQRRIDSCDTIN